MATAQVETPHPGEFIASEAEGTRSRENVTIASGAGVLQAGAVLGANLGLATGRVSVPTVVGTGNGVVTNVFAGPDCVVGNYVATCTVKTTHGGTFSVVGPNGALPSVVLTAGAGLLTNYRSREINFTIADGSTDYEVNDVFTFVVSSTVPAVVGTGNGVISAISLGGRSVKPGNYQLRCSLIATHGGTFVGTDPDGNVFGTFLMTASAGVTTVFTSDAINFSIADGSTDFAVGDFFNVAVYKAAATKYVAYDPSPAAWDGRHIAAGVLYAEVDATSADVAGVALVRDCEVVTNRIKWLTGLAAPEQAFGRADLAKLGVICRAEAA